MTSAERPGERVDLLVRNAHIITMDDAGTVIPDGAISIRDGVIVRVGFDSDGTSGVVAQRVIDAGGAPVHPGLVESHLHASFQTFRGALPDELPETAAFDSFESVFYNSVTDDEEFISVAAASLEMIRNGTTCFLEAGTVLSPSVAARAAEHVGIRAVLGDAFIWDQPQGFAQGLATPDEAETRAQQGHPRLNRTPQSRSQALAQLGGQLIRNTQPAALVTGHVALLGLGTASEELMLEAKRRADAAGVVINLHQSYSPADTAADRRRFGQDPLVHLAEIGFLDSNVTLAHVNHLTDAECDVLVQCGATIAWAPAASMMWGHGGTITGRHAELYRRGANIALGSDSPNWSNDFDLFRQANLAVLTARESHRDRTYLIAEDGLTMATRGGARAVGHSDRIGSIEPGKRADIVIHTLRRPELNPLTDAVRNLIYSSGSKSVHTVIIDGRVVLENGQFVSVDEQELLLELNHRSRTLLARMGKAVEPNRQRVRPQC